MRRRACTRCTRYMVVFMTTLCLSGLIASISLAGNLKKVVAVSRFENKTSWSSGQWKIGDGMADQLTDSLIQSGQFVVLERQTLEDVMGEQDLAASGRAAKSKSAQTGKITSAQILIKGTVTEFEEKSSGSGTGIGFKGFKIGSKKAEAHVGIIIRMIDTTTSEVLYSERVEGKAASGGLGFGVSVGSVDFGTSGFEKTPLGKAMQIAIDNAVAIIAKNMKNIPFQARVIKVSGKDIYVGVGSNSNVSVGDNFTVYSVGEELIDPDTGQLLGIEEEEIGLIKIYQVKDKYSKAKVKSSDRDIKPSDIIRFN